MKKTLCLFLFLCHIAMAIATLIPISASAYIRIVDSADDSQNLDNIDPAIANSPPCTLRKATKTLNGLVGYPLACPSQPGGSPTIDEIKFAPGLGTISLLQGELIIGNKTELIVTGPIILDGALNKPNDRILRINSNATFSDVTLNKVSFYNGKTDGAGGAILIETAKLILKINNGAFDGNQAQFNGGAIASFGAEMIITKTEFSENRAETTAVGGISKGGAIFTSGKLLLTGLGKPFYHNTANRGGAIYCQGNGATGQLRIYTYDFNGNLAGLAAGQASADNMGGGVLFNENCDATFAASKAEANKAFGLGGAIYNGSMASTSINLASFTNNYSICLMLSNSPSKECGGAAIFSQGILKVTKSSFYKNQSASRGGAILIGNSADREIGVANSTFFANSAQQMKMSKSGVFGPLAPLSGGTLFDGAAIAVYGGSNTVSKLVNNTFYYDRGATELALQEDVMASTKPAVLIGNNIFSLYKDMKLGYNVMGCAFNPQHLITWLNFASNIESSNPFSPLFPGSCPNAYKNDPQLKGQYTVPGFSMVEYFTSIPPIETYLINGMNVSKTLYGDLTICQSSPVDNYDITGQKRNNPCLIGAWDH